MARSARERAERFAWPQVTAEVMEVYEEAIAQPQPATRAARLAAQRRPHARRAGSARAPAPAALARGQGGAHRRAAARARLARRGARASAGASAGIGLTALALDRIGLESIGRSLLAATPIWVLVAFALMCASMLVRAEAWHAILRAALPGIRVRRRDTARGTMIGVLMSATMPARLGEPSRALIVARRLGRMRDRFPVVLGTIVSQTLLNILALVVLGAVMFATVGIFRGREDALVIATVAPLVLLALVIADARGCCAAASRRASSASSRPPPWRAARCSRCARASRCSGARSWAAGRRVMQLTAWAIQWLACYLLLVALGLDEHAGIGAAAAVLFAVNVTAALPATPSNLGVFQAACVAVLSAYGVGKTDALAYGIILQAVEIATAVAMGMPALVREGMTWKDLRLRALHASPVQLPSAARREAHRRTRGIDASNIRGRTPAHATHTLPRAGRRPLSPGPAHGRRRQAGTHEAAPTSCSTSAVLHGPAAHAAIKRGRRPDRPARTARSAWPPCARPTHAS